MRRLSTYSVGLPGMLLLVLVAGCGAGANETSQTGELGAGGAAAVTPPAEARHRVGSGASAPGEKDEPESGPSSGSSSRRQSSRGVAEFETGGGDNSIQRFGSSGSGAELDEAAKVLQGYLDARAGREWAQACSFMVGGLTRSLRQMTASGGKEASCPKLLAALSAGLPDAALREAAVAEVGALRVKGGGGFLLYHGAQGTDYFMPMAHEGAGWLVRAIAPSAIS